MAADFRKLPLCIAVALGAGSGAVLQQAAFSQEVEEVLVTGSRIQRGSGFTTPVPVTTISGDELGQYAPGNTVAEALDKLPQFFATETAQRGGHPQFSGGRSTLDMRGMGAQRTLVLIDGARTVPVDSSSRVNIDFIPSGLIERVDVVTGGASAAYGADALAGVTNFILNRRFEGFRASVQAGRTAEGDGDNLHVSLVGGQALGERDRLHLTWALESQRIDQILRNAADGDEMPGWKRNYGFVTNPEWYPGAPANVPRTLIMPDVHGTGSTPTGLINGAFRRADPNDPLAEPVADFPFLRHTFSVDGSTTSRYRFGDAGCYPGDPGSPAAGIQCSYSTTSGGPELAMQQRAFDDGIFGSEVKRDSVFVGLQQEIGERTTAFGHLIYGRSESNSLDRRGLPTLVSPWSATVFRDNAYLPEHLRAAMDAAGATELQLDKHGQLRGPTFTNFNDYQDNVNTFTTWSLALGLERELFETGNWNLTVSLQRGESDKDGGMLGEARVDRLFLAMDAVEVYPDRRDADGDGVVDLIADADRGTGEIICNVQRYNPTEEQLRLSVISREEGGTGNQTILVPAALGDDSLSASPEELIRIPGPVAFIDNTIRDCVPINIMGAGNVSPAAQKYLVGDKYDVGSNVQEFAEAVISGEISQGIGAGPFALAAGASYRAESFWQRSLPRELMAFGPPTNAPHLGIRGISAGWAGNRNVHLFTDFPAVRGRFNVREVFTELDFPLLDNGNGRTFSTNLAWRRSDYSLSGGITSGKLGLDIGITPSLRFRTTVSRDVREPTFSERFDYLGGGTVVNDPETGLQGFFTISAELGNPQLRPEKADTITGGFVYQPNAVPGLQVAVDYYQIDLDDQVDLLPYNTVVQTCYDTRDTTRTYCDFITRDPDTNLITIINNRYVNVASAFVSGVDLELLWNTDVDFFGADETLNLRLLAGRLNENSQMPFGAVHKIERAGTMAYPDLKAVASVDYRAGPYRVSLFTRYIPETVLNMDWETRPLESCGASSCVSDNSIESQMVTNLTLGYRHDTPSGASWDVSMTVSNLFDSDPPVVPTSVFGGGIAQTGAPAGYEIFGRQYLLRFGYEF
jgi:iron complex outermembrane receptor protein